MKTIYWILIVAAALWLLTLWDIHYILKYGESLIPSLGDLLWK